MPAGDVDLRPGVVERGGESWQRVATVDQDLQLAARPGSRLGGRPEIAISSGGSSWSPRPTRRKRLRCFARTTESITSRAKRFLLVGVFLVALGVDYNIFLMTRVREEAATHGSREAVLRGLVATGGVVTGAGLILAGTFATLTLLPLEELIQIARRSRSGFFSTPSSSGLS